MNETGSVPWAKEQPPRVTPWPARPTQTHGPARHMIISPMSSGVQPENMTRICLWPWPPPVGARQKRVRASSAK